MGNYRAKTNDKATGAGSLKIYDNVTLVCASKELGITVEHKFRSLICRGSLLVSRKEYGITGIPAATCHSTNSFEGTIAYFVVAVLVVAGREGKIQARELLLSASVSCLQRVVRSPAEQEISHARDSRGETVADKEAR